MEKEIIKMTRQERYAFVAALKKKMKIYNNCERKCNKNVYKRTWLNDDNEGFEIINDKKNKYEFLRIIKKIK